MNRITIISLAILMLFAVSCKQEQAIETSGDERILSIKQSILLDAPGYHNIELVVDSIHARYVKDSLNSLFPGLDTSITISQDEWSILTHSFNIDDVMGLDTSYIEGLGSQIVTLEITTTHRFKRVRFEADRPNIEEYILPIDSLNQLLNTLVEGL